MYDTLIFLTGGTDTTLISNAQPWISRWLQTELVDPDAPIFDGSLDWHSSVHARLAQVIDLEEQGRSDEIANYANQEFPANLVQGEIAYNAQDAYGIAWLMQLDSKLDSYGIDNLQPLAEFHFGQLQTRVESRLNTFDATGSTNIFGSYGDPNWMIMNAFNWGEDTGNVGVSNWAEGAFNSYSNSIDWAGVDFLAGDFFSSVGIAALTHVTMGQTTGTAWNSILTSLDSAIDSGRLVDFLNGSVSTRDAGQMLSLSWGMWAAFTETQDPAYYRAYEEITLWADDNLDAWGADFRASGHWLPNFLVFGLDLPSEMPVDWSVDLQQAFNAFDGTTILSGTNGDEFIEGTNQDDEIDGLGGNDVLYGGLGNDSLDGGGGAYNQVDYDGALTDYIFTDNGNGTITVTHPQWGTDTLTDIDGLWFRGDATWFSMADAVALTGGNTGGTIMGTAGNEFIQGTNGDDTIDGLGGNDVLYGGLGNDTLDGGGGAYNQVDYDGTLTDYVFSRNGDGSVTVTHPQFGTDTLIDIDGIWFRGDAAWYSIDGAIAATGGNTGGGTNIIRGTASADTLEGTNGDDVMEGLGGQDVFIWSEGNDTFQGGGDEYDQVDYRGSAADYTFTQNADGSVTVRGFGTTDTLEDIDGIWFQGSAEWAALDVLI